MLRHPPLRLYAIAWAPLVAVYVAIFTGHPPARIEPIIVAWQAVIGGLIYLAIAGGAYAWQNAQRVREEPDVAPHPQRLASQRAPLRSAAGAEQEGDRGAAWRGAGRDLAPQLRRRPPARAVADQAKTP